MVVAREALLRGRGPGRHEAVGVPHQLRHGAEAHAVLVALVDQPLVHGVHRALVLLAVQLVHAEPRPVHVHQGPRLGRRALLVGRFGPRQRELVLRRRLEREGPEEDDGDGGRRVRAVQERPEPRRGDRRRLSHALGRHAELALDARARVLRGRVLRVLPHTRIAQRWSVRGEAGGYDCVEHRRYLQAATDRG